MRKIIVFIVIVMVVLFTSFVYGQDCGKCPHKKDCNSKKEETVKKEEVPTPMVFVNKTDKMYHLKDCKVVKDQQDYTETTLDQAVESGLTPCTECKPPVKEKTEKEPAKEEKKN